MEQPSCCSSPPDGADSDESCDDDQRVNFSEGFLTRRHRRRRRRDPTAHIGADESELYEDPADVAERKYGLMTPGEDSAEIMFNNTPPPKIVSCYDMKICCCCSNVWDYFSLEEKVIERAEDFCFDNKEAISKSVKSLVIATIGNFLKPVKTYFGLNLKEGDWGKWIIAFSR